MFHDDLSDLLRCFAMDEMTDSIEQETAVSIRKIDFLAGGLFRPIAEIRCALNH